MLCARRCSGRQDSVMSKHQSLPSLGCFSLFLFIFLVKRKAYDVSLPRVSGKEVFRLSIVKSRKASWGNVLGSAGERALVFQVHGASSRRAVWDQESRQAWFASDGRSGMPGTAWGSLAKGFLGTWHLLQRRKKKCQSWGLLSPIYAYQSVLPLVLFSYSLFYYFFCPWFSIWEMLATLILAQARYPQLNTKKEKKNSD